MMNSKAVTIGFGGLLLAACAQPADTAVPRNVDGQAAATGDIARGETIAAAYCAACHAIGVEGESPHSDAPVFRTLADLYPEVGLSEALIEGIRVGHPDMPPFRFEREEVDDLIAYIRSVQSQRMG